MEISIDKSSMPKMTYQDDWDIAKKCKVCGEVTELTIVLEDTAGEITKLHNFNYSDDKLWFHDVAAFAIYACTSCLDVTVDWNQG